MKISVIVTSFNRPKMLRETLQSLSVQTHRDFEVILIDDSDAFDVFDVVKDFWFPACITLHQSVPPGERQKKNRLGVNVNIGLQKVTGDIVAYLADDDGYFPGWLEKVSGYFEKRPDVSVAFGVLKYSQDKLDFSEMGEVRFWDEVIRDPMGRLDHNQVVHRKFDPPQKWSENIGTEMNVDGWFFSQIANLHDFHPISEWAACKRLHTKNLQGSIPLYQSGASMGMRE